MPEFQVLNGPMQWQTVKVEGPRFLIGRREGCHLVLRDGWISREHMVLIETAPGEFMAQDLDSENGIFVNGVRVTEAPLKHADILRVGRTEMRFFNPEGRERPAVPEARATPSPTPALRPALEATKTFGEEDEGGLPLDQTLVGPEARRPGRADLRERVRRLEKLLQEKEEEDARLAAENAVFKRAMASAGLLDRETGNVDLGRLRTPPPREVIPPGLLPLVWNPLTRMAFPDPEGGAVLPPSEEGEQDLAVGVLRLGVLGAGSEGSWLADAFYRTGYRRVLALCSDSAVLDELSLPPLQRVHLEIAPEVASLPEASRAVRMAQLRLGSALRETLGTDRALYLLALGVGDLVGGASLAPLVELLEEYDAHTLPSGAGSLPVGAVLMMPGGEELEEGEEAREALETLKVVRSLHEGGRLKPVMAVDESRLGAFIPGGPEERRSLKSATVAGALDALNRLPLLEPLSGELDAPSFRSLFLEGGLGTFGLAGSTGGSDVESLRGVVRHALGGGLLCSRVPASRARRALVLAMIGSEVLAGDASVIERLATAMGEAQGVLPQSRPLTAIYQDHGRGVRVIAWIGGLPFPEELLA